MMKRLMRGGAAGLLAILAACAQQPRSTAATQSDVLTASTLGRRIAQQLPNLAVGGLYGRGRGDRLGRQDRQAIVEIRRHRRFTVQLGGDRRRRRRPRHLVAGTLRRGAIAWRRIVYGIRA
jgi:hypothetical protein